jgi:hypothetical protein
MSTRHKWDSGGISLEDAVEALSAITETHWEDEGLSTALAEEGPIDWRKAVWLRSLSHEKAVGVVKEIFKVILRHLQNFYQAEPLATDSSTLEGIKSIMLLVGEAAKKIDRFTTLFKESHRGIAELREYRQLQEFYKRKIARTIDEALLGKWILALTQRTWKDHEKRHTEGIKSLETKHVFVDMDSVQKDTEYELFFIRKEDGSRFFSPRLIKNIKLVCDFGSFLGQEKENDPLVDQRIWEDRFACSYAQGILGKVKPVLQRYYPNIIAHKDGEFASCVNKSVIALLLASNPTRLLGSESSKGCSSYLKDFQSFLREVLQHRDFQKFVAFDTGKGTPEQEAAGAIVAAYLKAIFAEGITDGARSYIRYLIQEGNELVSHEHKQAASKSGQWWNRIACDYTTLQKYLKRHPNGPLNKVLALIEEGDYQLFDPYIQQLLPQTVQHLSSNGKRVSLHCLPSPTTQEFINRAKVIDEFQQFLRGVVQDRQKVLLINFHDRTSWREYARATALEELQNGTEFEEALCVITLPKDTEFYRQEAPYSEDHQFIVFKKHLEEHFKDNHGGIYLPDKIRKEMHLSWMSKAIDAIHKMFFSSKNVLSREMRRDFIEILYLFVELKCLEIMQPNAVYFTCKDGVDIGPGAALILWIFSKFNQNEELNNSDFERIAEDLHLPPLLYRERPLLQERFQRMIGAIRVIENAYRELGFTEFTKKLRELTRPIFQIHVKPLA